MTESLQDYVVSRELAEELKRSMEYLDNIESQISVAPKFSDVKTLQMRHDIQRAYHSGLLRAEQLIVNSLAKAEGYIK